MRKMITMTVTEEFYNVVKQAAAKQSKSMSSVCLSMCLDFIEEHWPKSFARIVERTEDHRGRPNGSKARKKTMKRPKRVSLDDGTPDFYE